MRFQEAIDLSAHFAVHADDVETESVIEALRNNSLWQPFVGVGNGGKFGQSVVGSARSLMKHVERMLQEPHTALYSHDQLRRHPLTSLIAQVARFSTDQYEKGATVQFLDANGTESLE